MALREVAVQSVSGYSRLSAILGVHFMNNQPNDDIDPRDRLLSIDMDDDDLPTEGPSHDGRELTIGLRATKQDGEDFDMEYSFYEDGIEDYFLTTVDDDQEFQGMLQVLFIHSVAGARTFADPIDRNLFIQPEPNWIQLYFDQLPQAASDPVFGSLLWSIYSSFEVWLTDNKGNELRRLRIVPPTEPETEA